MAINFKKYQLTFADEKKEYYYTTCGNSKVWIDKVGGFFIYKNILTKVEKNIEINLENRFLYIRNKAGEWFLGVIET